MSTKPWTKAHRIEAARWLCRAAEGAATAGDLGKMIMIADFLGHAASKRRNLHETMLDRDADGYRACACDADSEGQVSDIDTKAMRERAEGARAAFPDPWEIEREEIDEDGDEFDDGEIGFPVRIGPIEYWDASPMLTENGAESVAAHVAGCHPDAVIALLDRLERAETAAEQARGKLAAICEALAANGCGPGDPQCDECCFACRVNAIVQP